MAAPPTDRSPLRRLLLGLFSHRLLAIARWDLHLLRVRARNAVTGQDRRVRAEVAARPRPLYLYLGSGPRGLADPHWVNVDAVRDQNVDYLLDVGRPLPFADRSFDGVFCEHVLEHFGLAEGERLAGEAARVLRPSGWLRVVVPDAERIVRSYLDAPAELSARRGAGETAMETVNAYFRQRYEHQFLYDWPTLEAMLARSGFRTVSRAAHGEGPGCPPIVLDDPKYAWESLYVEAAR
jgi:predicted SAM-dependent methyltransferase